MPRITIRVITVVLVVAAGLLVAGGLVYLKDPAHALPTFFPGHDARSTTRHTKDGLALMVFAVLALAAAWGSTAPVRPGKLYS